MFLFSLLPVSKLSAQSPAEDEKYFHILKTWDESIFKQCFTYTLHFKESGNYEVTERAANGIPTKIRFTYTEGVYSSISKEWSSLRSGWIDVFFRNGLPYAAYANDMGVKKEFPVPFYIDQNKSNDFTVAQIELIRKYFKEDKQNTLENSPSYKSVLKYQSSFPKEWDVKNNLGIVYNLQDNYKFEWVEDQNPAYGAAYMKKLETYSAGKVKQMYYRNISNHIVVIKGINKRRVRGGYEYIDESMKLKPGEIIDYFTIYNEFDNSKESDYSLVQYFGDLGLLTNLMAAKTVRPGVVEVDSYVNTTTINIKKGDKVNLKATGKISLGTFAGEGTPDGITGFSNYSQVEGFNHGALLGRIGKGAWFLVGSSKSFVAATGGILQLTVNDGDPENNFGVFTVEFAINKMLTKSKDTVKFKSQAVQQIDELKATYFVSGTIYFEGFGHPNVSSAKASDTATLYKYYDRSGPGTKIYLDNCVYKNANGGLSIPINKAVKLK